MKNLFVGLRMFAGIVVEYAAPCLCRSASIGATNP
jgi:hypothetical protein